MIQKSGNIIKVYNLQANEHLKANTLCSAKYFSLLSFSTPTEIVINMVYSHRKVAIRPESLQLPS